MESVENNPARNVLGPGLTDQLIKTAIEWSGYPLQLVIANELNEIFLQEEWAFPDSGGSFRRITLATPPYKFSAVSIRST